MLELLSQWHARHVERDDPQRAARVVVHTVDAQLHRVMTRHGFDIDALMATVNQLVPPPDRGP